ncbi:MAG: hypothetical protein ABFD86_13995, partial [Bryobacteraceae bacterium]
AAYLYDIETARIGSADFKQDSRGAVLSVNGTNWFMALLREADGPAVAELAPVPPMRAGESRRVEVRLLTPPGRAMRATLIARGLNFGDADGRSIAIAVPGTATVTAPRDAAPGRYQIELEGPNLIGMKRFLDVLP